MAPETETTTDLIDLTALLAARYGAAAPAVTGETNPVLASLLAHRSVRRYTPDPLPNGCLERLIAAAQSAATSSNLQTWSVIALQDAQRKADAALLCGDQDFIRQAPLFLVFCADLARLTEVSRRVDLPATGLDYIEMFIMATIDASLAAQNLAAAAEAEGLGLCYVGAARNRPRELAELLHLPTRVFALFGMALGWPADTRAHVKPRLPQQEILHNETYQPRPDAIAQYDEIMQQFYIANAMRSPGPWSARSAERVASVESLNGREILRAVLEEREFGLK